MASGPGPARVAWHRDGARLSAAGPGWAVRAPLPAPGAHVAANAALALAAVARLGCAAERLQRAAAVLGEVALPGRGEIVSRLPWVLVDGAHTAASARALAETVTALQPARVHLLLSLSQGKDVTGVLDPLLPLASRVTVTCADPDYSLAAEALARAVHERAPDLALATVAATEAALARACDDQPGETLVVATGSVYLAGRVRVAFTAPGA
ncbi:MAG: hypothetical protein U5K73_00750 [Halofilum sp. (in: g-proteobacteria)]|nr:hypothetical protein [Halofilum sp. (in: g-proteobacteria)]